VAGLNRGERLGDVAADRRRLDDPAALVLHRRRADLPPATHP
jgi:hypothetical protein